MTSLTPNHLLRLNPAVALPPIATDDSDWQYWLCLNQTISTLTNLILNHRYTRGSSLIDVEIVNPTYDQISQYSNDRVNSGLTRIMVLACNVPFHIKSTPILQWSQWRDHEVNQIEYYFSSLFTVYNYNINIVKTNHWCGDLYSSTSAIRTISFKQNQQSIQFDLLRGLFTDVIGVFKLI